MPCLFASRFRVVIISCWWSHATFARSKHHSSRPNGVAVVEDDEDGDRSKDRVFIEAMRAIKPDEELTYNYGITLATRHTPAEKKLWACRCGSPKCTGTMLQPKR